MKRTITAVLSPQQVAQILAQRVLEEKCIETVPGSMIEAEMLACFEKDDAGNVGVAQYRIEFTVDQVAEDWKG